MSLKFRNNIFSKTRRNKLHLIQSFCFALVRKGLKWKAISLFIRVLCLLRIKVKSIRTLQKFCVKKQAIFPCLVRTIVTLRPFCRLRYFYLGRKRYKAPAFVPAAQANTMAIRWLIASAQKRYEPTLSTRIVFECIDALLKQGVAWRFRRDYHLSAFSNRAYIHFLFRKKR